MPLFSTIARSIRGRMSKSVEDNPDGALAKYLWLWQSMGKRPGRSLIPRPIRFFFAASLDVFSLVGWHVRTGILRVVRDLRSKEAIMRIYRTNLAASLAIMVGMAIGGGLTFTYVLLSHSDDVPSVNPIAAPSMTSEARADAIDRAERILRTRIDEFGVEEPNIQRAGADRLIVGLPGQFARFEEVRERGSMACQYDGETFSLDWNDSDPWVDLSPVELRIWWEGNRSLICFDGVGVDTSIWDHNHFLASDFENTALLTADAAVPLYGALLAGVIRVTLREDRHGH